MKIFRNWLLVVFVLCVGGFAVAEWVDVSQGIYESYLYGDCSEDLEDCVDGSYEAAQEYETAATGLGEVGSAHDELLDAFSLIDDDCPHVTLLTGSDLSAFNIYMYGDSGPPVVDGADDNLYDMATEINLAEGDYWAGDAKMISGCGKCYNASCAQDHWDAQVEWEAAKAYYASVSTRLGPTGTCYVCILAAQANLEAARDKLEEAANCDCGMTFGWE